MLKLFSQGITIAGALCEQALGSMTFESSSFVWNIRQQDDNGVTRFLPQNIVTWRDRSEVWESSVIPKLSLFIANWWYWILRDLICNKHFAKKKDSSGVTDDCSHSLEWACYNIRGENNYARSEKECMIFIEIIIKRFRGNSSSGHPFEIFDNKQSWVFVAPALPIIIRPEDTVLRMDGCLEPLFPSRRSNLWLFA